MSFSELPHSKSCFVCGSKNPIGLNLRFKTDGRFVESTFTLRPEHCGFVGVVHGGILATILDELMVWGCAVQAKQFSYCAEMSVRYISPGRAGAPMTCRAEMTENKRGKLFVASGELKNVDGSVIATSTAKYIPVRGVDLSPWFADFEGTPEQLREFLPPMPHQH
ncbi:MAG TPA: PaaI family thioesterase [Verrucomicrobiae bacterium]